MRAWDWICFVSSSLGIWHCCFPEEGCLQLPERQGFAMVGTELGAPHCPGLALQTPSPRDEMQPHSAMGTSHQPCTHRLQIYPCMALGSPCPALAGAGEACGICFPHPRHANTQHRQEMGRLVQFLQKETQTQADVQGHVWPAPPTPVPQLDSALVWGLCQMSSQWLIPPSSLIKR